ncbi:hypothetical protein BBBOND_0307370 [Babesia bigemina]|uniref:Uncharacterized protein n=1 Tax=Babesia bigemina TaxID=5866 RepID=A0A061D8J8_BABBI|nr:hypothetical protein BBBOND_0307370 [Babesia bigemina]CDR96833.1 hypothetical protein BBBOND_0307370 [Babesia bigemina]|eukprot:XP_012769019.1 hypothetical protein BBBOND_0307370 [Babesia bigemina]
MKINVATVFRALFFVLLSVVLHVQGKGRSFALGKARDHASGKSGAYKGLRYTSGHRGKTQSAVCDDNFYCPGAPTLAKLGAAIPF